MAKGQKKKVAPGDVATNRQARHRYELLDKLECGIVLQGTEVKALRTGTVQIKDAYCQVRDGELWLQNCHIPPYGPASRENHEPERPRKLLAHRREIAKLARQVEVKGMTLVPLKIYFKNGRAKLLVGLAQGKTRGDKRQTIAKRDAQRDIQRAMSRQM